VQPTTTKRATKRSGVGLEIQIDAKGDTRKIAANEKIRKQVATD
jgi:hypothetical protein